MSAATMTTSDGLPGVTGVELGEASSTSPADLGALTNEIQRLANQYFAGVPGPAVNGPAPGLMAPNVLAPLVDAGANATPPHVGPNAAHVGAGGASPLVQLPPTPGPAHRMPLAATPPPKDADLRGLPTQVAEQLGTPGVIAAASSGTPEARPYFMDIAGLPAGFGPSPHGAVPSSGFDFALPAHSPMPTGAPHVPAGAPHMPAAPTDLELARSGAASPHGPALSAFAFAPELVPDLVPELGTGRGIFDPHAIKRDFPILQERAHGRPIVWLDNAATTQKPRAVIERLSYFYEHENSNVHRAAHTLAARATDAYEGAREKSRRLVNAPSSKQIVFVRGTTEGINLIAKSWGRRNVYEGDEILITWLEHHANIVPWQQLCAEKGAKLKVAPVDDSGQVILDEYEKLLGPKTKLVSFTQVSNALGTIVPAKEMITMAHRHGACVLLDGAQSVSHMPVDVQDLDCDFFVFSGHKMFGPTGIGAVYGKQDVLDAMPPWQGGGNMIADVTFEKTIYQPPPQRFEAGTGNIADAVGLGAAVDYLTGLGLEAVSRYEHELLEYADDRLRTVRGLRRIGTAKNRAGVISFVLDGVRTEDVGGMLDLEGIAVRSGHHCAQPILRRFGVEATVRASLAPYNTTEDIDALVAALNRIQSGRAT